ncbi:ATP-dependent helicase [Fuerstiella marisgermanici]|uniref:DNA 3'-5' helicase n=1 Tax=Fuerstiella marisgermanici TaxID=1891926 RepID=A0A1P8WKC1_9PLAN|nr:UvrD-helicase domain-containing protein [Fuerstiella marisgermanici]APZ94486.1 ATP-dependent DNA helicase PcrA [Fuerstiella marisgermanici]
MLNLSGLNPPQRQAVETLSGPLLVLAGAGTGKTRVITFRMANLIRHGIRPDRILSVTFTNKASREMRERALKLLGSRVKAKPVVSTFHAYCVRVLREDITALGYPKGFVIYDRSDQESAARTALREIRVGDKAMKPGDLLNKISSWKMSGLTENQAGEYAEADFDALAAMAYRKYQKQLRASGAVDFDDLLLLTSRLFKEHPEILQKHQAKFDHVQVDEYQDTNGVQFSLVENLVQGHQNICVVGDDDQSIYGWRGAEVQHILNFGGHFANTKTIRLENNYRCTNRIVEYANRLVRHNRNRHEKKLIAHKPDGSPVRILAFEDETQESENVVKEIAYLITELSVRPKDIAILFRTNEQPRLFETEMRRLNVPYVLLGGQSFFDRKEIRDLLAYLKVLAAPRDEVSLLRIINTPARGIGATTTEKLVQLAVSQGKSLWEVVPEGIAAGIVPKQAQAALSDFRNLLVRFRDVMLEHPRDLADHVRRLLRAIDYNGEIDKQYKDETQAEQRKAVLEDLVNSIGQYVEKNKSPTLEGFLETTALMDRDDKSDKDSELADNAVRLMTLHSAKGLEFPRVYLVGMEENLLPHRRSVESDLEKDIAEERRLAYVGVTRAMDYLTLTRAKARMKWGKRRETVTSRFLFEMQKEPGETLNEEHVGGEEDELFDASAPKQTLTSLFDADDNPPF